jgi:hypothetical protein
MSRCIGIYVTTCNLCNRTKLQHRRPFGELHPLETPAEPWDTISVDFIVELPESHGYNTNMCVVDSLTKHAHFIPTHTTINAEGMALLFLKEVWKHHETPRVVLSDRGSQFMARFTHKLYKLLGIKLATSMVYYPQTDGQTERVNQELEGYLRMFTSRQQDNWDNLLPLGEFSHNQRSDMCPMPPNQSHLCSPEGIHPHPLLPRWGMLLIGMH